MIFYSKYLILSFEIISFVISADSRLYIEDFWFNTAVWDLIIRDVLNRDFLIWDYVIQDSVILDSAIFGFCPLRLYHFVSFFTQFLIQKYYLRLPDARFYYLRFFCSRFSHLRRSYLRLSLSRFFQSRFFNSRFFYSKFFDSRLSFQILYIEILFRDIWIWDSIKGWFELQWKKSSISLAKILIFSTTFRNRA